ncbi:type IV toxin-antitoxin system AbiEi family antitoxin domain-containing protein [Rhodococcoides corynebacterioides]|uniref:type IV toxin-antitoxin system AbiEi family antitoxin domain-containing protein n=1 Tax=Rhodococcoides corynebacterioides TaxID=53972 RepID=UPI003F82105B
MTRAQLAAAGVEDQEIRTARGRGSLVRVGRGVYSDAAAYADTSERGRHLLAVRGVVAARTNAVVSHTSAAILHDLRMWNPDLSRVHLSIDAARGGRRTARVHTHTNRLTGCLTQVRGPAATTVAKTAVDLARVLAFEAGVCVVDSALSVASRADVDAALDGCTGMSGCSAARRIVAFADGRSESIGESRTRVYLQRYGFPPFELQVTLRHGAFVCRPDFLLDGVIVEFDGRMKYTSEQVLFEEKKRHDELMSLGWTIARLTWADLASDAGAVKVRRAMALATGRPPPLTHRVP